MGLNEFHIGLVFYMGSGAWVCTDVGSRVVVAVRKDELDLCPAGPPYSIEEVTLDEYDQKACQLEPYSSETTGG